MTFNSEKFNRGFSLFEMLIVVTIIGILALAAVPVAELSFVKSKESELEVSLSEIRLAITQYKIDCLDFLSRKKIKLSRHNIAESEIFPRELIHLVNPVQIAIHDRDGNIVTDKNGNDVLYTPTPYLKRIPADPFAGSPIWAIHCASTGEVATFPHQTILSLNGTGVYDISVATLSAGARKGFNTAINGTDYRDW